MVQPPHHNTPSPYRSAALGLTLFVVGGFFTALAAGVVWGGPAGWLVFGGAVVVGLLWSVMLMSVTINHKAYLERRIVDAQAAKIENESEVAVITARTQEMQVYQHRAGYDPQSPAAYVPMITTSATGISAPGRSLPPYPEKIRVMVVPRKGPGQVLECPTRLVQWAISDCWPIAA